LPDLNYDGHPCKGEGRKGSRAGDYTKGLKNSEGDGSEMMDVTSEETPGEGYLGGQAD